MQPRHAYQLVCKKQDGLQTELAVAKVEEILKGGPKEVHDHGIVVTLGSEPSDKRHTNTARESLVHFRLVLKLWVLSLDGFKFDADFLSGDDVDTEVDVTCRVQG